jgi:hypothetical protein
MHEHATPPVGDRRILWVLVGAVILLQAMVVFLREIPGAGHPVPKDFAQYYVAGLALRHGEPDALYFTDMQTGLTTARFPESRFAELAREKGILDTSYYIYPPWVGLLYAPFTVLSPYRALVAVNVLSWIMTILALVLLARVLPAGGWVAAAATFALLIHTPPFLIGIAAGQASIPVLLLAALFGQAMWRGKDVQAGIWLAIMTGIKLFPVLFVPYLLVTRRWRVLIAFVGAGVVILGLSVGVAGIDAHVRFLKLMLAYMRTSTPLAANQSVTGFLFRLVDPVSPWVWSILPVPPALAWGARAVLLGWLGLTLWLVDRLRRRGGPWWEPVAFSLALIWVFSAASNVWLHHLVALAVPFTVAAAWFVSRLRRPWWGGFALWTAAWAGLYLYAAYYRIAGLADNPAFNLLVSFPFYGVILLFVLTALIARRELGTVAA